MLLLSLLVFLSLWYHLCGLSYGYTQGTDRVAYKQLIKEQFDSLFIRSKKVRVGLGYVTLLVPVGRFVLQQDADTPIDTQLQTQNDFK